MPVEISVDARRIKAITRALRKEADGKELRKGLVTALRDSMKPVLTQAKAGVRSMPSTGGRRAGLKLRTTVANKTRLEVKVAGNRAGARMLARKTPNLRTFRNAARALNRPSWTPRNFGTGLRRQVGAPGWFDGPTRANHAAHRRAARDVLRALEKRLATRTR